MNQKNLAQLNAFRHHSQRIDSGGKSLIRLRNVSSEVLTWKSSIKGAPDFVISPASDVVITRKQFDDLQLAYGNLLTKDTFKKLQITSADNDKVDS